MLVSTLLDKFDGQITSPRYDARGDELLSSKIRRAVEAHARQVDLEKNDPTQALERKKRIAEAEAEERNKIIAEHDQRFWNGMPAALRQMGLADQELEGIAAMDDSWPAWLAVREWMDSKDSFCTMGGDTGTGKTLAAARVLGEKCKEFIRSESFEGWFWRTGWGRFVKASSLARLSYYAKEDREWLERLGFVRWLVIDELAGENSSSTFVATFFELIEQRARNKCRTIITTNLTGDKLKRYDERVMRRLRAYGRFVAAKRPESIEGA